MSICKKKQQINQNITDGMLIYLQTFDLLTAEKNFKTTKTVVMATTYSQLSLSKKKQYTVLSCLHHSIKWSILHYCLSQTDFGGAYIHSERFLFSNSKINMIYSLLNRGLHKSSDWSKSNSQLTILKIKFFKKRLFRQLLRLIILGAVA